MTYKQNVRDSYSNIISETSEPFTIPIDVIFKDEPSEVVDDIDKKILIIGSDDYLYIGEIFTSDLNNISNGIDLIKPFNLKVTPLYNQDQVLQTVALNFIVPFEFCGMAIEDQIYSGFVNVQSMNLQQGLVMIDKNTEVINSPSGKLIVKKINSLVDTQNPMIRICKINKILKPSPSIKEMYLNLASRYNEIINNDRSVSNQQFGSAQQEEENLKKPDVGKINPTLDDVDITKVN